MDNVGAKGDVGVVVYMVYLNNMKKILIGVSFLIISLVAIATVNPGGILTPWLMKISLGPKSTLSTKKGDKDIPYSKLFTVKAPKVVLSRQTSKLITAKLGGSLSVTDAAGVVATLVIPPGALGKDTTITIAPLQEVPIEKITGALGNGVVINPEGLQFLKSAQITFDYKPAKLANRNNQYLALAGLALTSDEENAAFYEQLKNSPPEDFERLFNERINAATEQLQNLGFPVGGASTSQPPVGVSAINPLQLGGAINATIVPQNTLPKQSAIIHIDHKTGRINVAETTRSVYGSKLTAVVNSLSSFGGFNIGGLLGDQLGNNDLQNGAADAGGACTPAFLNAMLRVASWQQRFGGLGGDVTAMQAVRDCGASALAEMELRCEVAPEHVTRREMLGLIQMLQYLNSTEEVARATALMESCKRIYSVSADVEPIVQEGKSKYGISAQLCGYLDEKWVGTEIVDYRLDAGDAWAEQVYVGDIGFKLPYGGGSFQMTTRGTGIASGKYMSEFEISVEGDGQIGTYDGNKQMIVNYRMYGSIDVPLTIEITKQQCESTNELLEQSGY